MTAVSVTIADAVKTYLNGETFTWKFDCKRLAFPNASIQESDGLLVSVFMGPRRSEQISRRDFQHTHTIYLVIQRKFTAEAATSSADTDDLAELVESIEASLEGVEMAGYAMFGFTEDVERVPFNVELLRDTGVFVAIVGIEYTATVAMEN